MLAAYATRVGGDEPLANLEVGERPRPEPTSGWALLRTEAISLTEDREPVEYRLHLYRPDRFRLEWPVAIKAAGASGWSITQSGSMSL